MVLDLIVIGLAIALEPLTLVAFILILSADKGVLKGLAFIFAWLACLVAVIAAVVLLTGGKPPAPKTGSSTAALVIKAASGALLIWVGLRRDAGGGSPGSRRPGWRAWTTCRRGRPPVSASSCSPGRWWPPRRRRSCRPSCPRRVTG